MQGRSAVGLGGPAARVSGANGFSDGARGTACLPPCERILHGHVHRRVCAPPRHFHRCTSAAEPQLKVAEMSSCGDLSGSNLIIG